MYEISKDKVIYKMDKTNIPVLHCGSGDTILFETCDCFSDSITKDTDLIQDIDFGRINPATGPVFIEGAETGDVLRVQIDVIRIGAQGAVVVAKDFGLLGDQITESQTLIVPVVDDKVFFKGVEIPMRKMIGVIGTAPAGEGVETGSPDAHGGNMDCRMIGEGATLYLPVNVKGALLALGDLHAAMGDGEIGVSGVEIAGEVEVTVEVLKDAVLPTPMVETKEKIATIFSAPTMEEAAYEASARMAKYIQSKTNLQFNEAVMLLSAVGDLSICQVVDPEVTLRMEVPKTVLEGFYKE